MTRGRRVTPFHVLVGPDTRFDLASNAKQCTAAVIFSLALERRLALDTDVRTLLPEQFPQLPELITVRDLLTHTSGLRDVYDLWSLAGKT